MEWETNWTGWLVVAAGVGLILLGGPNWPPSSIGIGDIMLGLLVASYGGHILQKEGKAKQAHEHGVRARQRIGEALAVEWPDAPDDITSWIGSFDEQRRLAVWHWTGNALSDWDEHQRPIAQAVPYLRPDPGLGDGVYNALRQMSPRDVKALRFVLE